MFGAGGPAGVNLCRALHDADHEVVGVDGNPFHLPFAARYCVETHRGTIEDAARLDHDLILSQPEQGVAWLAHHDHKVTTFVPRADVISVCRDKARTARQWYADGLRDTPPVEVRAELPDWLHQAQDKLGNPFWLRATRGAGARGATLVTDLRTAFHWIRYWQTRNSDFEWVAEEYLPGRDFCFTSVWHDGQLTAAFTRERLEWLYPHLAPSGRTGTPTVCVTVHDERVNDMAIAAIKSVDWRPHGVYAVDLREDRFGLPRPTEINAGRFPTTSPLYYELGVNLPDLAVRGAGVSYGTDVYPAGMYLLRHIDCGTVIASEAELGLRPEPAARLGQR